MTAASSRAGESRASVAASPTLSVGDALRIGELAERSGRSVHTIRWYEAEGLMPGVVRDAGGRRVYRAAHLDWLDLIDRLQRTGMSIAAIREYAVLVRQGKTTLRQRQDLLAAHRERVVETIKDWKRSLDLIDRKIDFYDAWLATGHRPKEIPVARKKKS
jgi:DNA-binding transcriptional MerR regulator